MGREKEEENEQRKGICLKDRERLTNKEQMILEGISSYQKIYGFAPTVRELCGIGGLSSPSTILSHLRSLEKKGYVMRRDSCPRAMTIL
jgi:repressor LexA